MNRQPPIQRPAHHIKHCTHHGVLLAMHPGSSYLMTCSSDPRTQIRAEYSTMSNIIGHMETVRKGASLHNQFGKINASEGPVTLLV